MMCDYCREEKEEFVNHGGDQAVCEDCYEHIFS